ncbi:Uridine_kinase domain-containing protein [Hexamita inflata]|uniref:Uridine kinase domain-containing protein n=1 Tax=Hexamita inflata TaxID=28002 RepID=A0AA86RF36_9EUKA|nr:Uridine kinase domain-containing protein [Hexamita inflata]
MFKYQVIIYVENSHLWFLDSVIEQYARFVKPSFDKFIQPQIKQAHLVLPWENIDQNTNLAAVELLINYISVLASQSNSRPATPREYQ